MKFLTAFFLFFAVTVSAQNTKIIAHRGYWDTKNSAQNSLSSLKMAQEINAYGSEFDVNMTSDGKLVVSHGPKLEELNDVQKSSFKQVKQVRLKNGEKVPTLAQYLKQGKKDINKKLKEGKAITRLILELKVHPDSLTEAKAVKKTVKALKRHKMLEFTDIISFSLNACKNFVKILPEAMVQYLNGDLSPKEIKDLNIKGLDYHYKCFINNPQWVKQAHELGLKVNVWTVSNKELLKQMIDLNVDFITTDTPVLAMELLK